MQGGRSQAKADPLCCIEDILLSCCLLSNLLILPFHVRGVVDKNALFKILGALSCTWKRLLGLKSGEERISVVKVHLCISVVLFLVILTQTEVSTGGHTVDERQ